MSNLSKDLTPRLTGVRNGSKHAGLNPHVCVCERWFFDFARHSQSWYNGTMLKIIIALILIFVALGAMYRYIGVPKIYSEEYAELPTAHSYGDPTRAISEISINAFYFVPQNRAENIVPNWREILENNLQKLQEFHSVQFLGRSRVTYRIYPQPIIGFRDGILYDTEDTGGGNPQALRRVSEEIEKRVFDPKGDLYMTDFDVVQSGTYPVLAIMYEGVGSIGGVIYESKFELAGDIAKALGLPDGSIFIVNVESADGFFLVNKLCLEEQERCEMGGPALFAHEFYHTIGISDEYDGELQTSSDIMGSGRFKRLEETYLNKKTVRKLGL